MINLLDYVFQRNSPNPTTSKKETSSLVSSLDNALFFRMSQITLPQITEHLKRLSEQDSSKDLPYYSLIKTDKDKNFTFSRKGKLHGVDIERSEESGLIYCLDSTIYTIGINQDIEPYTAVLLDKEEKTAQGFWIARYHSGTEMINRQNHHNTQPFFESFCLTEDLLKELTPKLYQKITTQHS